MKRFLAILAILAALVWPVGLHTAASPLVQPALAAPTSTPCPDGTKGCTPANSSVSCGSGSTNVILGINIGCSHKNSNPIYDYLAAIIKFLSGIVGLGVVLMLIIGGIQYMTSSGNPQAVAAAKKRIGNALLGLVLFLLMFGILNFIIPGGILQ